MKFQFAAQFCLKIRKFITIKTARGAEWYKLIGWQDKNPSHLKSCTSKQDLMFLCPVSTSPHRSLFYPQCTADNIIAGRLLRHCTSPFMLPRPSRSVPLCGADYVPINPQVRERESVKARWADSFVSPSICAFLIYWFNQSAAFIRSLPDEYVGCVFNVRIPFVISPDGYYHTVVKFCCYLFRDLQ